METYNPSHLAGEYTSSLPSLYHRYRTSMLLAFFLIITLNLAILACILCKRLRRAISNHSFHQHNHQNQVRHQGRVRVHQDLDQEHRRDKLAAIPIFAFGDTSYFSGSSSTGTSFEYKSCTVCLGEYVEGEVVRMLPRCMHMFHRECIDQWLRFRSSCCPLCRDQTIDDTLDLTTITTTASNGAAGV